MVDDEFAFEIELLPYHFLLPVRHHLDLNVVLEEFDPFDLFKLFDLFGELPQTVEFALFVLEVCDSS